MKFEDLKLVFDTGDFLILGECEATFTNNIIGLVEIEGGRLIYYNKEKVIYASGFPKEGE